jgi:hypothetical protein
VTDNLIAAGRHRALVRVSDDAVQFGTTGEGENEKEQVVVLFDLVGESDPDTGRSINWFGFLNDKNFDRTIEALRYCGWEGDELAELSQLAAAGQLALEVDLVIEHEEYEGRWQAKVRWVNRPGGGAVKLKKPLDGQALAAFSARMKGRVRVAGETARAGGSRSTNGQRVPPSGSRSQAHPNAPGGALDDIPF